MVLSKTSCKMRQLVQGSNHPLRSVVLCVHGEVGRRLGLVTVMLPAHSKVLGFRGVKKIPFRGHEMQEPLGFL